MVQLKHAYIKEVRQPLSISTEKVKIKCSLNNKPISEDEARKIIVHGAVGMAAKRISKKHKVPD